MKKVKPNQKVLTIFGGLLIVVALVLVACGGTTTSSSTTAKKTPTSMPSPTPITHLKSGQTATFVGKWKIGYYDWFVVGTSILVTVTSGVESALQTGGCQFLLQSRESTMSLA